MGLLFSPTGGLTYHARALRFRKSLWSPFRQNLNQWLQRIPPQSDTLLWVGSSAGYCVEPASLKPYSRIIVIEVDPVARWLLHQRFPGIPVTFVGRNLFHFEQSSFSTSQFQTFLQTIPHADLWFSNILGQVAFLTKSTEQAKTCLEQIKAALTERNWLSFHDRISLQGKVPLKQARWDAQEPALDEQLASHFFTPSERTLEVFDHGTKCLEAGRTTYLAWPLTPLQTQIIGCARSAK